MKTKKVIKVILMLVLAIIMLTACTTTVEARPAPEDTMKPSSSSTQSAGTINPDNFKPSGLTASDYYTPFKFAGNILTPIITIGVVISITMVMVLGMKYMLGSVEEKAEYKKSMVPMLVGAILLFTSSTIVGIIYGIMESFK